MYPLILPALLCLTACSTTAEFESLPTPPSSPDLTKPAPGFRSLPAEADPLPQGTSYPDAVTEYESLAKRFNRLRAAKGILGEVVATILNEDTEFGKAYEKFLEEWAAAEEELTGGE